MPAMPAMPAEQMIQTVLAHLQSGRLAEAEVIYRQLVQSNPSHPEALHLLGLVAQQIGKHEEAIGLIGKAINADPAKGHYYFSLANSLHVQGLLKEAAASYRQAILLKPDYIEAHSNLGNVLQDQGLLDESIVSYRQALLIDPDFADTHCNLGTTFLAQHRLDEAAASFRQALLLRPDFAEAHSNLGNALKAQGRLDEAIACYRQALQIRPDYADAYNNLGNTLHTQNRLDEAIACYRQALLLRPDFTEAHSNLIFALDMVAGIDTATLQAERQRWSAAYASGLSGNPVFSNRPDPERRLRIGYVSADFKQHSAAIAFGAMLTRFDRAAFDVYAYSHSVSEDGYTGIFRQSVTHWKSIVGLTDAAVADLIRQDGIDILVDLSGHSAGNRLRIFARKPAPLQITAWGYAGGTGMEAMDVLFSDPVIVPLEEKSLYAEEVRYLPCVLSAFFPDPFPPVNSLPAQAERGVTFGSFNRLAKVSAEAYRIWAQILRAIPASRMLLKTAELDDPATRERILGYFTQAGIDPARILFQGKTTWHDHVAAFNRIDISLDPFPQSGGVTTLEGLMMGVPVVTWRGTSFVGRGSASILTTLGLADWIAETPEQYVDIAVQKAKDLTALADLRQQLRPRFMTSIIGDTTAYARIVEQEYRKLWREWCRHL